MNVRKIILEEVEDFQWIKDIEPIPNEVYEIPNLTPNEYKIWFGNIPPEQQLTILYYLENELERIGYNNDLDFFIQQVSDGDMSITSLYIEIHNEDNTFNFSYMGSTVDDIGEVWPIDGDTLEHDMNYYNDSTHIPLNQTS